MFITHTRRGCVFLQAAHSDPSLPLAHPAIPSLYSLDPAVTTVCCEPPRAGTHHLCTKQALSPFLGQASPDLVLRWGARGGSGQGPKKGKEEGQEESGG